MVNGIINQLITGGAPPCRVWCNYEPTIITARGSKYVVHIPKKIRLPEFSVAFCNSILGGAMKDQHEPITVVHQAFADSLDSRAKLGRPNCQYLQVNLLPVKNENVGGLSSWMHSSRTFLEMECNLAKTAIFRELVFQENLMVVAWFLTTFPSTKSNQRPAMDPWCVAPKKTSRRAHFHRNVAILRIRAVLDQDLGAWWGQRWWGKVEDTNDGGQLTLPSGYE